MRMKSWLKVAFAGVPATWTVCRGVAVAALSLVTSSVMAQAPAVELKAGDMAPAFSLQGSDGKTHTLAEHRGKRAVVLAWFPKAFTAG